MNFFSKIKKAKKPDERISYPVEDNKEMIFAQATDKEQQNYSLQMMFKHDAPSREALNTKEYFRESAIYGMAIRMLNQRFGEKATKENPPYMSAGVGYGGYVLTANKKARHYRNQNNCDTRVVEIRENVSYTYEYEITSKYEKNKENE